LIFASEKKRHDFRRCKTGEIADKIHKSENDGRVVARNIGS
jgi:hypothetical protein